MAGIKREFYGKTRDGKEIELFTLTNTNGMTLKVSTFGGVVVSLTTPDKNGNYDDVVLGYDNLEGYLSNKPFFGGIIGRHANRIEGASFEINGITYTLTKNEGENQLHGGEIGFHKAVWVAKPEVKDGAASIILSYTSRDGEEGYPGNLEVTVTYTLTEDNSLKIDYYATTDKDTVVNLTNHTYFNLSGHASGSILKHKVYINADKFTVNNKESLPTGEIRDVVGTPMDFTKPAAIEENLQGEYQQLIYGNGFDHNWILNVSGRAPEKAAEVFDEISGRVMEIFTTKPGIQFYTGNYLNETENYKDGARYSKNSGLCLETQYFPNALKHSHFPQPILRVGQKYRHTTIYKFSIR